MLLLFVIDGANLIIKDSAALIMVFLFGNVGGYISVHSKLKNVSDEELGELADSWLGVVVPSFIGGVLAVVLYLIFIAGLLEGDLFPNFEPDADANEASGFTKLFEQHGVHGSDYAKLLIWSFVAGYSERYVVNIIESFQGKKGKAD